MPLAHPLHDDHRVLQSVKASMKGAKKGYELLKKKSDAIKNALNSILKEILDVSAVC